MRQKHIDQVSIFDLFSNHEIGKELKAMSARLDQHRDILDWVARDLQVHDVSDTGRQGLPAESVSRCALLKQFRQLSYQELAFHLSTRPLSRRLPVYRRHCFRRSPCYRRPSVLFSRLPGSASISDCWVMPNGRGSSWVRRYALIVP